MTVLIVAISTFAASVIITGLFRWYAIRNDVLDTPTARSSHEHPTPRGGGLSVVVIFVGLLALLFAKGDLPEQYFLAFMSGSLLVGGVGFVDDHRHVAAAYRFGVHTVAAVVVVYLSGGIPPLPIGTALIELGWAGNILAVIFLVWLTNLYNFMDGIDGLAAVECIFIVSAAIAISAADTSHYLTALQTGLAASCAGFLVWNWPPAKIFMGDAGSGFVGFTLGALAIVSAAQGLLSVWTWLILAGVFFVDATVTVVRRMARGEKWYEAHRSHAYQRASRQLQSHRSVTIVVCLINILWLLPLAVFSAARPDFGWWLMTIAWLPVAIAAIGLGAGLPDSQDAKLV